MIESEELSLKVAENPIEEKWIKIRERAEQDISNSKIEIEINEEIIKLSNKKINNNKKEK